MPLDLPGALPELWFWAADRSDEQLIADVRSWATREGHPPDDVGVGPNGLPGWFPVVLELGEDVDAATGLVPLRRAVAAVHPSWAALLPESGIAVPGLAPDIPSTGVLPNVWVNDAWIDGQRERLLHVLEGAHREELAGGVLIMTDQDLVPDGRFADWCYDPAARWDRLVDAAAVLAAAARASRPGP